MDMMVCAHRKYIAYIVTSVQYKKKYYISSSIFNISIIVKY